MALRQILISVLLATLAGLTFGCRPPGDDITNPAQTSRLMQPEDGKQLSITGHVYTRSNARNEPVADAIVYLCATDAIKLKADLEPVKAKVKDGRLVPEEIHVAVGQKLVVEVEDKEPYALRISTDQEPEFGTSLPPQLDRWERTFTKPANSVPIKCDIHPEFQGMVIVFPNWAFVRTAKDGSFILSVELPAGSYEICAYHPMHGRAYRSLDGVLGNTVSINFDLSQQANSTLSGD